MTASTPRPEPIDPILLAWTEDGPRLRATRCRACGEVAFPMQAGCPACPADDAEEIALGTHGRLWTWTIQRFPPPSPPYVAPPDGFEPFGVGYVELPEGVRVESRLTENDPNRLAIGMELELTLEPYGRDDAGRDLVTFAFRPIDGDEAGR